MQIDDTLGIFFKSETQTSGRRLVADEKVLLRSGGDTAIQAVIRMTPPVQVKLSSESVESHAFTAECGCSAFKKGQLCKHLWATLLCVAQKYPDFLSAKTEVHKSVAAIDPHAAAREEALAAAKQRASERRKEHYRQQKARTQKSSGSKVRNKMAALPSHYPPEVEAAIQYFAENGFPMAEGPSELILSEAKRKLSRVFHPDKGGSHEESVQLNRNCDLIRQFLAVKRPSG
jgi:uncharacterized Zn finger protein